MTLTFKLIGGEGENKRPTVEQNGRSTSTIKRDLPRVLRVAEAEFSSKSYKSLEVTGALDKGKNTHRANNHR